MRQQIKRAVMEGWKEFRRRRVEKRKRQIYACNYMYRRKMRLLQRSWRDITKEWGRQRIHILVAQEKEQLM